MFVDWGLLIDNEYGDDDDDDGLWRDVTFLFLSTVFWALYINRAHHYCLVLYLFWEFQ